MLPGFILQAATNLLTRVFLSNLLLAQALQLLLKGRQGGFTLFTLNPQTLDFLASGQHAAFGFTGAAHTQKVTPDPITVTADQALTVGQLPARCQCLLKGFDRFDLAQPGRQIKIGFDFVQQTPCDAARSGVGAKQAQIALRKACQIHLGKIIHQHSLEVGTQHRFDRKLPTGFNPQAFGQTWTLSQLLLTQPFACTGARVQRGLLQRFKGSQTTV